MIDQDVLDRPLFQLRAEELAEVRAMADTLFARLCRPFRQHTYATRFSFAKTLRSAERTGHFLPQYERKERPNPKSRVVIAMSLSGIDRCYAVGLIPLLAQLRNSLDFKLYIYTDDCVPAVFTDDGFLENDVDLAWNNSNWVNLLWRLGQDTFHPQEDHLLVIDSLGGDTAESRWFTSWSSEQVGEVQEAQKTYLSTPWATARQAINGRYARLSDYVLPFEWKEIVQRNTKGRWLDAPAMYEYLVRWAFHPQFGRRKHGRLPGSDSHYSLSEMLPGVRGKFKTVHLLTPRRPDNYVMDTVRQMDLVDYHHEADTLEGFGKVLANIVFGKETRKFRVPHIKIGGYQEEQVVEGVAIAGRGEHTELVKGVKCFAACPPSRAIPDTQWAIPARKRQQGVVGGVVGQNLIPYNEINPGTYVVRSALREMPAFPYDVTWSPFSNEQAARGWLDAVRTREFYCYDSGDESYLSVRERPKDDGVEDILNGIEFTPHRTRGLRQHVEEWLRMVAPAYRPYLRKVPLRHVVWCSEALFRADRAAVSVRPTSNQDQQRDDLFHELFHYLAFACPAVNVFTNHLLRRRSGKEDGAESLDQMVVVGPGEYALPPAEGQPAWIKPYAGKYYPRRHRHLCNDDEIGPTYSEYLRSVPALLHARERDEQMLQAVGFVLMGGPLALLERVSYNSRRKAMREMAQSQARAAAARQSTGGRRGGRRPGSGKATTYTPPPEPKYKPGGFGL